MNREKLWKMMILTIALLIIALLFFRPKKQSRFAHSESDEKSETASPLKESSSPESREISGEADEKILPSEVLATDCPTREFIYQKIEQLNERIIEGYKDHCHQADNATHCSQFSMMDENLGESGPLAYEIYDALPKKEACEFFLLLARKGLRDDELGTPFKVDYEAFVVKGKKVEAILDVGNFVNEVANHYVGSFSKECGLQNSATVLSKSGEVRFEGALLKEGDPDIRRLKFISSKPDTISFQVEYLDNPHPVGETIMKDYISAEVELVCTKGTPCEFVSRILSKKNVPLDEENCQ